MTSRPRKAASARERSVAAHPVTGDRGSGPGHRTRDRILRTAFQLFHEQGYHATGVATILREAGVNAGSLYHFFPSKEALLVGVLDHALVLLRPAVMDPAERRSRDPIQRVFELLRQYREAMDLHGCRMGCPIGNLALEVADDDAEARRLIHRNFENWVLAVKQWLDDAGDRLPRDLDRAQLARFILTVMEGGIMQARAAGSLAPLDDSIAQLRSYVSALEERAAAGLPAERHRRPGTRAGRGKDKEKTTP